MSHRIPVTVVTGFLGSGKTTLLSNLLHGTPDRRLAIVVNEFGEVSIDGAVLRGGRTDGVEVHDLAGGLVAYGEEDRFGPIMEAIRERKNHIDHVLVETSGLALPVGVLEALERPGLREHFVLDATLAVVDTPLLLAGELDGAAEGEVRAAVSVVFERQLEHADVVVLNKIDGMDEERLLDAETRVRERAPRVRFVELAYGARLDTRLTLGLQLHASAPAHSHHHHHGPVRSAPGEGAAPLADQAALDGHAHGELPAHAHGAGTHEHFHEHDPGWQSFVLRSDGRLDPETLRDAVREAALQQPILRAKGFAQLDPHHRL
ncbi:MAG: GTP-binding protein, partial [Gemmatimonadetes bacterium]|nr:GTP-binding protein [Gemmatimonadota bacterium]